MKMMICFKSTLFASAQSASGYKTLLFFALLISVSAPTYSQQDNTKSGWAISKTPKAKAAEVEAKAQSYASEQAVVEPVKDSLQDAEAPEVAKIPATDKLAAKQEPELGAEIRSRASGPSQASPAASNQVIVNEDAEPQPVRPVVNVDPQLRKDLEAQFQRMRSRLETDDAFSEALGEEYLSYGLLLKKAGRLDEARKMFVDAQHIVKVNNGVYAIEQRPALRALFETNYLLGEAEDAEANIEKIIWLENQHPEIRDNYSFDLVLKLGNYFLDIYISNPSDGEAGKLLLDKADKYLSYATRQYGAMPISQALMPYGELALLHLYKSRLRFQSDRPFAFERQRQFSRNTKFARNVDVDIKTNKYFDDSFSKSEFYLKLHLKKAKNEGNLEETVWSLIGLGDINLLFGRTFSAAEYYKLAWLDAENLPADHPIVLGFDQTHPLPAFRHALRRSDADSRDNIVLMPLTIDINQDGKVTKVNKYDEGQENSDLFFKARRVTKRTVFRPIIENGKLVGVDQHLYELHLPVRNKKTS